MKRLKRYFYFFIHLNFISGFLYAFWHFINTPKSTLLHRRLWAYESWVIISFYCLFVYLILAEKEVKPKQIFKKRFKRFKQVLLVNLLLLIFPWGLFLLLTPKYLLGLLGLGSVYWRVLGIFSLLGAVIYYFPYHFYKNKLAYYVLIFGAFDKLLAGIIFIALFLIKKVPLIAFSATPLLFYFAFFFFEQARNYKKSRE